MLTYRHLENLEVIGYQDSYCVGCLDNSKSTFGYMFLFVGGGVPWKSSKQSLIASSILEAKFVA